MESNRKFADLFEIKRPLKTNMKKAENSSHYSSLDDDQISRTTGHFFIRNSRINNSQKNKYTKPRIKKRSDNKTSVKKIAEEYEKKFHETIQHPKVVRTDSRSTNEICVSQYEEFNRENMKLDYPPATQMHIDPTKGVHGSTSLSKYSKSEQKQTEEPRVINNFIDARTKTEQEIYRKTLLEEISFQIANMKTDGFIDEKENPLVNDEMVDTEICDKQCDFFPSTGYDQLTTAYTVSPLQYNSEGSEQENLQVTLNQTYVEDDFSENLGDDLEDGTIIAEAYNDEGRELILVQIILDRKIVSLDSSKSIKDAVDEAEFVFYQNEGEPVSIEDQFTYDTINGESISCETSDHKTENIEQNNQIRELEVFHNVDITERNSQVKESEYFEVIYDLTDDLKRLYSVPSTRSSVNEDDDEGISIQNSELGSYNMRRETFCDHQGVVRIERVGYPEKRQDLFVDENSRVSLSRNNSAPSTKRLDYIIEELKVTEKKYVNDLGKVIHIYRPYIQKHSSSHQHYSTIFGNIKKIYKGQKKFLNEIENCCASAEEVASVFIDFESLFDLYPAYLKNKPKADLILRNYNSVLKQMQEEHDERLDFSAYLLTPLQRLGKYIIFLENILKELKELQLSKKNTQIALKIIKKTMSQGNDYVAIESIDNSPISKSDYGSFIMREKFAIIKPRRYDSMIFLFTDVIVFTINDEKSSETFNYVDSIRMNDLRIATFENGTIHLTDYTKGKKKRNTAKYNYVLEAKTEKIRDSWREVIENILWQQLRNARENSLKLGGTLGIKFKTRKKSTGSAVFYVDQLLEETLKEH